MGIFSARLIVTVSGGVEMVKCHICPLIWVNPMDSDLVFSSISPLSYVIYGQMNLTLGLVIVVVGIQLIGV